MFRGGGEMTRRIRDHDWSSTPLGDPAAWPQSLRAVAGICLNSSFPTAVYWGPDLRLLYNDSWAPIPGDRHPAALGKPAAEVWSDIWDIVGPQFARVIETGEGFSAYDQMLPMLRDGRVEETYWTYSFTPVLDEAGRVAGILNQGNETTDIILTTRSQSFMLALGDRLRDVVAVDADPDAVLETTLAAVRAQLDVARVGYAEIEPDERHCVVVRDSRAESSVSLVGGRFRLDDFGRDLFDTVRAGAPGQVANIAEDPRIPQSAQAAYAKVGVVANLLVPLVRNGRAIALLFLNHPEPRRWNPHEIKTLREVVERMWLALERARALARLKRSETRFAALFGQSSVGLTETDVDGRIVRVNDSMARMLGRPQAELVDALVSDLTHPDDLGEVQSRIAGTLETGEPFDVENRYVRPDGSSFWAVSNVSRLVDDAGRANGVFAVTSDITERRDAERLRTLLLAELNHRVKNNLTTVQALVRQTLRSSRSPEQFEAEFGARLMALSRAHDLIMRETWTSADLRELLGDTLAPYAGEAPPRVTISGPEVRLSPTAAVTLNMAFHELATNAAKFGALSAVDGHVEVDWTIDSAGPTPVVELFWRERGGPAVAPPVWRGFGSRLIERGLAQELGGQVRLDFAPAGVFCAVRLPLSEKVMAS